MAEVDNGGVADFLRDLYSKTRDLIIKELAKRLAEFGLQVIGGTIAQLIDKLAQYLGLPTLISIVTELVSSVIDYIFGVLLQWWGDEIFTPVTTRVDITSIHEPIVIASSGGQGDRLNMYGDGGHYTVDYAWVFSGAPI
jgi:hypothetical protein